MSDVPNTPTTGHVYDGIQEYDNPLPGWWTMLFYLSILFAACYYFVSLVRAEWTSTELRYEAAKAAELNRQFAEIGELEPDSATILSFIEDPEKQKWLNVGAGIFQTNCVSCHARDAGGMSGSGPNMTDDHFLKVKTIEDVAKTVVEGSVSAGMPAWANRLSTNEIVLVSSYAASLRGTNVPGGQPPQGEVIPAWNATN